MVGDACFLGGIFVRLPMRLEALSQAASGMVDFSTGSACSAVHSDIRRFFASCFRISEHHLRHLAQYWMMLHDKYFRLSYMSLKSRPAG